MAVTGPTAGRRRRGRGGGGEERAANQPMAEQYQGVIVPSCGCCAPWGQKYPQQQIWRLTGTTGVSPGLRDPLAATSRVCTSPGHISHIQPVVMVPSIHFPHFIKCWPKLSCPVAMHQLRGLLVVGDNCNFPLSPQPPSSGPRDPQDQSSSAWTCWC